LVASGAFPRTALAAYSSNDPITVTSQIDTVHFPQYINFDLSAQDTSGNITHANITIIFSVPGYRQQENDRSVPIAHPAHSITLHWREDTSGDNFYPPGTKVNYTWQLQDITGHFHTDSIHYFTTIDTRFNWQELSHGLLHVDWYNRPQNFGQLMLEKASASIAHITTVLGNGLLHSITLWVYASDEEFHGSLAPNSYEWVGGQAIPPLDEAAIVAVGTSDDTLVRDMPHELTHLVFHQLIQQGIPVPTWFDEGLAVYNQIYHEPDMAARLQEALDTHTLLRFNDITDGFPANSETAYLAYAQSWNFMGYLYSTFGQSKMALLIKKFDDSQTTFDGDLQQALGEDQAHLENQWRIHLHQPPILAADQPTPVPTSSSKGQLTQPQVNTDDGSAPLLITVGVLLVLASLAALTLAMISIRRRKQQALAVLSAEQLVAANARRWQQPNQMPPASYMQSSLYAQLAENPRPVTSPPLYPTPKPEQLPGTPPSAPWSSPTPTQSWKDSPSTYPTITDAGELMKTAEAGNGTIEPGSSAHSQEYLSQQPRKQTPQE